MFWRVIEKIVAIPPDSKFRRWALLECPIVDVEDPTPTEGYTLQEIFQERLTLLTRVNPGLNIEPLKKRLDLGNHCMLCELNGVSVLYRWVLVNTGSEPIHLNTRCDMRIDVVLPPGAAYCWDDWTAQERRGAGAHPASTRLLRALLRKQGCTKMMTVINVENAPSLRAYGKVGFKRRAILTHLRLFGLDCIRREYP
jgi:hypothetical protein